MRKVRGETTLLKIICAAILSLALVVMGLFPANVVNAKSQIIPNDETGIPDKNLYQAILSELDKKSDKQFTKAEAESLYSVGHFYFTGDNENKKVKTLKGIDNLVNLRWLEIPVNSLKSLKGVEKLTNLQELRIWKGNLNNLNELKNLPNLTELSLEGVKLEDWTAVSNLTKLEKLNISDCGLTNSSLKNVVSKMAKLTTLEISKNSLKDLKSISGLTKLETLDVRHNKLKSLSGIEKLTKLQVLYVDYNKLKNLSGIDKLTEMQELYATNNKLTNLKEIKNLTKLQILDVSKNKITSLPSLKKHKKLDLEYSSFSYNKISEKVFIKNLPSKVPKWWRNNEILLQNLKKKLKIKVKIINGLTKEINGVTEKKATLILTNTNGEEINRVKANKKGVFSFRELDLEEYKGKKLKITAYMLYDDRINGERHKHAIRTVKITA